MFSGLKRRLQTAGILIGLLVAMLILAGSLPYGNLIFVGISFFVTVLCAVEFAEFAGRPAGRVRPLIYFALVVFPCLMMGITFEAPNQQGGHYYFLMPGLALSLVSSIVYMLLVGRKSLDLARQVAQEIFVAIVLIGGCGGFLISLPRLQDYRQVLVWLLMTVIATDTGAYFCGSYFKGPKLAEAISPNKTFSGAIGGSVIGILVGVLGISLLKVPSFISGFCLSVAVVLAAQVGDLAKSYLKRLHMVKDSGNVLPGHGGLLDRVDGLLMASPVLYMWYVLGL